MRQTVITCSHCHGKMRVPADKHVHATCPTCGSRLEVKDGLLVQRRAEDDIPEAAYDLYAPAHGSRPWYWTAPELVERLAARRERIHAWPSDCDPVELLEAGLAPVDFRWYPLGSPPGRMFIHADVAAMLAAGRLRELKAWAEESPDNPSQFPPYLRQFLQHGDAAKACGRVPHKEDVRYPYTATATVFLARICGESQEARRRLANHVRETIAQLHQIEKLYERGGSSLGSIPAAELVTDAKCWLLVLDDEEEARACLGTAETASHKTAWAAVAGGWLALFGDTARARRCLEREESRIASAEKPSADNWQRCARAWLALLADERRTRRCLERAEAIAKSDYDWICCAEVWIALGEEQEARWRLEVAENAAREGVYGVADALCRCAESWAFLLADDRAAQRCLKEAETVAESCYEWLQCVKSWLDALANKREARRCLKRAEAAAKDRDDWLSCADTWSTRLADERAAQRCRRRAETATDETAQASLSE